MSAHIAVPATDGASGPAGSRGSASLVLMVALAFAAILAAFGADVSRASAVRGRAQAAADAAALAAAQELVLPSERSPAEVAAAYAEANGARVAECRCDPGGDDVVVTVETDVTLPFIGQDRTVAATARAVVAAPSGTDSGSGTAVAGGPSATDGLQPSFAAGLGCLFARVPGLTIVSGFRTRAEQAALYREKPDLAAPPGRSNHERGLAADLGFASTEAQRAAHAAAPGCGLEFPISYEPWHVEPAGR